MTALLDYNNILYYLRIESVADTSLRWLPHGQGGVGGRQGGAGAKPSAAIIYLVLFDFVFIQNI